MKCLKIVLLTFAYLTILTGNAQVRINELLVGNLTVNYNDKYNFSGWIELYNTGNSTINISGWYLSDDSLNLSKWKISSGTSLVANSFKLFWCDELNQSAHTNFKLRSEGGKIYLSDASGVITDSITYPPQHADISYGRANNLTPWGYFTVPSPLASNVSTIFQTVNQPVSFSKTAGNYSSPISVELNNPEAGTFIRYTTDGSQPTPLSAIYMGPLNLTKTTVLKARTYSSGAAPSKISVATYLINEHSTPLPVASISMNPTFLWDNILGIHAIGTNGITGNCLDYKVNWNQDWDRACSFELLSADTKQPIFTQDLDTKISGACSRSNGQKSLAFEARNKFGTKRIDYPLFQSKKIKKYDTFLLRNSGNDFPQTLMRDALMQGLLENRTSVDVLAHEFVTVYLNAEYWGIMNLQEKADADYFKSNYDLEDSEIDFLERNAEVIKGSNSGYNQFISSLKTMNMASDGAFDYIASQIDVDNYIQYQLAEIYYANTDWPGNNIKFWRPKEAGGKWRWILFDPDFGFGLYNSDNWQHQTLHFATQQNGPGWPNPDWSTFLFRTLLQNPQFKARFIQSFQTSLHTLFNPTRVHSVIDSLSAIISPEIPYHRQKWGGDVNGWNWEVQRMREFATKRYNFMQTYLQSYFNLQQPVQVTVGISPSLGGSVRANGILVSNNSTYTSYKNFTNLVKATPTDGYRFKQWVKTEREIQTTTLLAKGSQWSYYDKGMLPASNWYNTTYSDVNWLKGAAQLGYGESDEQTTIGWGPDAGNKYMSSYFRTQFNVSDIKDIESLTLSILYDDGVVVYLNGTEVKRINMPAGSISYSTPALGAVSVENTFEQHLLDKSVLKTGTNLIAVEVHQNSVGSSDLSFDAELTMVRTSGDNTQTYTDSELAETLNSSIRLTAQFEPIAPIETVLLNEICATGGKFIDDWNEPSDGFELYNAGTDPVDLSNLFLTDDRTFLTKFRIPKDPQTVIQSDSYTIFWADDDEHQGPRHTNFNLSASGEWLALVQICGTDTIIIDSIQYKPQGLLASYGRYPNASKSWQYTVHTPGQTNKLITTQNISMSGSSHVRCYPNPTRDFFVIEHNYPDKLTYRILNMAGQIVDSGNLPVEPFTINCADWQPGVYIVQVECANESLVTRMLLLP